MIERLYVATIVLAASASIVLLLFLPIRWLVFYRHPELRHRESVPKRQILLWIGGPVACVYTIAIHPFSGAALTLIFVTYVFVAPIFEYSRMSSDDAKKFSEVLAEQRNKPFLRAVRFVIYAIIVYVAISVLIDVFK